MLRTAFTAILIAVACSLAGCSDRSSTVLRGEKYTILDTRTDQFDFGRAKELAEDAIVRYQDELHCMVGLFAYNPPKCLEAVRQANKLGEIKIVAFDEEGDTLQGIADGHIYGTVVQNPYMYGYESVRILAGLARGDESVLPPDGFLDIHARKITGDNVHEFWDELKSQTEASDRATERGSSENRPTVAYVTNGIASFWVIAEKGARAAARDFNVNVEVRMPPKGAADQKRMIQDLLTRGIDGIAISPIDPDNQTDLLNEAAQQTHLITQDSDAPDSNRLCYVGMDNYIAGRMCGELVKEVLPEGGNVMIFVGRLAQLNAQQRRAGLIDELLDRERETEAGEEPTPARTEQSP